MPIPNEIFTGPRLDQIAFPLGGIGAGMICLEGSGGLSNVSIRHKPDRFNQPLMYAALWCRSAGARVLQGPIPRWKISFSARSWDGLARYGLGFPRFADTQFTWRFPFANIDLRDPAMPLSCRLTAWSPFIPGDLPGSGDSSLPVAALEYKFHNPTSSPVEAVFSFHMRNFLKIGQGAAAVRPLPGSVGFVCQAAGTPDHPWEEGAMAAMLHGDTPAIDCAWFRGGFFDAESALWRNLVEGKIPYRLPHASGDPSPGASLYLPLTLAPGQSHTAKLLLAWYIPKSDLRLGADPPSPTSPVPPVAPHVHAGLPPSVPEPPPPHCYAPWYASRYDSIDALAADWRSRYDSIRQRTQTFTDAFYDSTLPPEVIEAAAANLAILKSPTVLRQHDGNLWCWEGCQDTRGSCHGSCTHVWNYAQAIAHLFPYLERSLRHTEFGPNQNAQGHQDFRAFLPIRPTLHEFHSAVDGQLGGIVKVYRDWRISGDTPWLAGLWPAVAGSLDYCIRTFDPQHTGALHGPQHNTYDIEFWGPSGMLVSFYLAALAAAARMGQALDKDVSLYLTLAAKARALLESDLFNGEYFFQKVEYDPQQVVTEKTFGGQYSQEAIDLLKAEGPKYQYGAGCLADGALGLWLAAVSGLDGLADPIKLKSHLAAVHRHNLRRDLTDHINPQRPGYALGNEGGLLLCTWPRGGKRTLPFPYSDEVWTGIEYAVASHLFHLGLIAEGLEIVRLARARYDGSIRNPFNEYECGHWYGRALASYGMLITLPGLRYDAVEKVLYLHPKLPGDFRAFLSTATGLGVAGVKQGQPFLEVRQGRINVTRIDYHPHAQ